MKEQELRPILKQFLLSITGNDIMRTNNNDYTCIDKFLESDRFKNLQAIKGEKNRCDTCNFLNVGTNQQPCKSCENFDRWKIN